MKDEEIREEKMDMKVCSTAIELKNVSYSYQGKHQTVLAVDRVSYIFDRGTVYAIAGTSGSGKTTLMSLMAGLDLPTEGEILVEGINTKEWDRNRMRRDYVSVIYQNYNLFPLLTVHENICYPLKLQKKDKAQIGGIADRARDRVSLPEAYNNRLPGHLSGGEQQRVAIARTLAQGCRIILADEPTGNLDSENTLHIVEILCRLAHEDGCTVIIVTHDPAVAEQADVVLHMRDGRLE